MKNLDWSYPILINWNYARPVFRLFFETRFLEFILSGNEPFRCILKAVASAIANTDYTTQAVLAAAFAEMP
jgi:hypothetical protein